MKRIVTFLFAILALGALVIGTDYWVYLSSPVGESDAPVVYEVKPGATLNSVTRELSAAGLITRPLYWKLTARVEDKARRLRMGEFRLNRDMTPREILDTLVAGATVQYSLTVLEGWTFRQMLDAVHAHPQIEQTLTLDDIPQLMADLGQPDMHPEGWFYPDTYHFPKGTTDRDFLARAYRVMADRLAQEWEGREADLPLNTPYDALIMASIVERETAVPSERPMIAAVFISRLRKGMRLQTDPTVIYGMGERYDGNIRKSDLQTDTPYNTYTRAGLTPTPIALPSGDAVHAVLHPAETDALYFVARGDGSHHFSATYDEHRAAVIRYQLGGNASRYKGDQ